MNNQVINDLTAKYLQEELSQDEEKELNALLQKDASARSVFLAETKFDLSLREHFTGVRPIVLASNAESPAAKQKRKRSMLKKCAWPLTAAACAGLGFWMATFFEQSRPSMATGGAGESSVKADQTESEETSSPQFSQIEFSGSGDPQDFAQQQNSARVWLDSLDTKHIKQGWGEPQLNQSVGGKKFSVAGENFARGIGTHSFSDALYELHEGTKSFSATVGVSDDELAKIPAGTETGCLFKVSGDGKVLWESGVLKPGDAAKKLQVPLHGVKKLRLIVEKGPGGDAYDHANWMDASFLCAGDPPTPKKWKPDLSALILTPPAGPEPQINGAKVLGGTPEKPFLFRIPTTGQRPIEFAAVNLPGAFFWTKTKGYSVAPCRKEELTLSLCTPATSTDKRSANCALRPATPSRSLRLWAGTVGIAGRNRSARKR